MATKKFIVQLNQTCGGEFYEELGAFWSYDEAKKFAEDYKVKSGLTPLQAIIDMCNASPKRPGEFWWSDFENELVELEIVTMEYDDDDPYGDLTEWETIENYCLLPDDLKDSKNLFNILRSLNIDPCDIQFVC